MRDDQTTNSLITNFSGPRVGEPQDLLPALVPPMSQGRPRCFDLGQEIRALRIAAYSKVKSLELTDPSGWGPRKRDITTLRTAHPGKPRRCTFQGKRVRVQTRRQTEDSSGAGEDGMIGEPGKHNS